MFFFFKQKTAYEMRIRDWSSDWCSISATYDLDLGGTEIRLKGGVNNLFNRISPFAPDGDVITGRRANFNGNYDVRGRRFYLRSEEHTSELQSLMRISYAVFCLKKKTYEQSLGLH